MELIPKNKILEHGPDSLFRIRKEYNLDKPGVMKDAIRILREWVEKQNHFKKKDFPDHYLETAIIACKGSIERAKSQIDKLCTFRTILPQFFGVYNVKTDFGILFDAMNPIVLPKLTPDLYRVLIVRGNNKVKWSLLLMDTHVARGPNKREVLSEIIHEMRTMMVSSKVSLKLDEDFPMTELDTRLASRRILLVAEYSRRYDYCLGYYVIVDFNGVEIMDFLPNLNPMLTKQIITILIEGYGMRVKGIHLFSQSKLLDSFIALLKQVLSQKISDRIHCHTSLDELRNILPIDIFPVEYGGNERPYMTIFEEWSEELSSKEFLNHLKDMSECGTDESCRQGEFNEQYAEMSGTFRTLRID